MIVNSLWPVVVSRDERNGYLGAIIERDQEVELFNDLYRSHGLSDLPAKCVSKLLIP